MTWRTDISRDEILGFGALLVTIVLFSTIEVVTKFIGPALPPLMLAFLRFFLTGVVLLIPAVNTLRNREAPFHLRDAGILAGLGLVGVAIAISLYHLAIPHLRANAAAIIFSANPAFVVLFSPWILGEKATWRKIAGTSLGLAGTAVFLTSRGRIDLNSAAGIGLMLGAMVAFALYTVLSTRFMPHYGAIVITCFASLTGSLILLPFSLALEPMSFAEFRLCPWPSVLYLALIATAAAYVLFFYGLLNVGAWRGSMFFFLKPGLASFFAWLILGEAVTKQVLAGVGLVVLALALTFAPGQRRVHFLE